MTRKDYLLLSYTLATVKPGGGAPVPAVSQFVRDCKAIAAALSQQSQAFNRRQFLADCGVSEWMYRRIGYLNVPAGEQISTGGGFVAIYVKLPKGHALITDCDDEAQYPLSDVRFVDVGYYVGDSLEQTAVLTSFPVAKLAAELDRMRVKQGGKPLEGA